MILFDTPRKIKRHGVVMWAAHLIAETNDDMDSLHAFAASIGLRREWLHDRPRLPHYDLLGLKRIAAARTAGATEVTPREFVERCTRFHPDDRQKELFPISVRQ